MLRLPLIGAPEECLGFGVWSTLSEKNFGRYIETFDSGEQEDLGPWFGWLSNRLKGYPDTLNLKCQVHPQSGRQRPWLELEPTDHYERFINIYAAYGHSVGPAQDGDD